MRTRQAKKSKRKREDSVLFIKINSELRASFKAHCAEHQKSMAEVLRKFIKGVVKGRVEH